jgi:hypothetical protein
MNGIDSSRSYRAVVSTRDKDTTFCGVGSNPAVSMGSPHVSRDVNWASNEGDDPFGILTLIRNRRSSGTTPVPVASNALTAGSEVTDSHPPPASGWARNSTSGIPTTKFVMYVSPPLPKTRGRAEGPNFVDATLGLIPLKASLE